MANLFDFEDPCAILTSKNYGSNSVAAFPPQIYEG